MNGEKHKVYKNPDWKEKEDENCVLIQQKNQILNSIGKYVDLDM